MSASPESGRPYNGPRGKPQCGRIAQLVEQLTLNQRVLGSSPSASTTFRFHNEMCEQDW